MNSVSTTSSAPSPASTPLQGSLRVSRALIEPVLRRPQRIRNVCILAHVDHGKTTLTDTLLASNGIISFKQAGKLRYLDSREDEQVRGITMEASAITLLYDSPLVATSMEGLDGTGSAGGVERYAVNLIDSPGHVDFSRQVVTAARLCDGCLVLVDAVEGVCTQTLAVLRQAQRERLTACLVINKIDRLITELKLSTTDAAIWLHRLLEQVNAACATIKCDEAEEIREQVGIDDCARDAARHSFGAQEGNVVFASSTDGWAFTIDKFVRLYANKLEMNPVALQKTLWGDYYFDARNKRVLPKKTAEREGLVKPMLAQFVLDPIWSVYDATVVNWNEAKITKISTTTGAKISSRELKAFEGKGVLKSIMGQWLPLAETVFNVVVHHCPSPLEANRIRLGSIIKDVEHLAPDARKVVHRLASPDQAAEEPMVAFISKFFSVTMQLHSTGSRSPSCEDLGTSSAPPFEVGMSDTTSKLEQFSLDGMGKKEKLIGMARMFHGTLKTNQTVYLLGPQHTPEERPQGQLFTVRELYLLMGRDLEPVDAVMAGSVFGIGGLDELVEGRKNATLSSTLHCPCLSPPKGEVVPIVHVAIRPAQLEHLSEVVGGLRMLCQADPCAETFLEEESGEYILATAGELHLEQCLKDLKERYTPSGIELIISPPIVPYRETISGEERNRNDKLWRMQLGVEDKVRERDGLVSLLSTDRKVVTNAKALAMPDELLQFILTNKAALRGIFSNDMLSSAMDQEGVIEGLRLTLSACPAPWSDVKLEQIWAIGPRRDPTNLLLVSEGANTFSSYSFYRPRGNLKKFQSSILTAFEVITSRGPLAHEPMMGVAFMIEGDFLGVDDERGHLQQEEAKYGDRIVAAPSSTRTEPQGTTTSSQLIPLCKTLFEVAFLFWSPRLMLASYRCSVQTTAEMLGRVYSILSKRHGRIISEEYHEGTGFFSIIARLPVVESFGLANDLRGRTAGVAIPQLVFAGYDRLPEDPFWVPSTEEELVEFGKAGGLENSAMKYLLKIRERKGLYVEKKIVQFAEKQRTLKK